MSAEKRKGQHTVKAVIRIYSGVAQTRLLQMKHVDLTLIEEEGFNLAIVKWAPPPSKNEYNTQSDWRRTIADVLDGLYFDVLAAEYDWKLVKEEPNEST